MPFLLYGILGWQRMHLKQCHTSKYVFFYAYKLHYAEKNNLINCFIRWLCRTKKIYRPNRHIWKESKCYIMIWAFATRTIWQSEVLWNQLGRKGGRGAREPLVPPIFETRKRSVFESRFALAVFKGVLGPPRLTPQHTGLCPCISVVREATCEGARRVEGPWRAQSQLKKT